MNMKIPKQLKIGGNLYKIIFKDTTREEQNKVDAILKELSFKWLLVGLVVEYVVGLIMGISIK
jgi:hypothetical protein